MIATKYFSLIGSQNIVANQRAANSLFHGLVYSITVKAHKTHRRGDTQRLPHLNRDFTVVPTLLFCISTLEPDTQSVWQDLHDVSGEVLGHPFGPKYRRQTIH